MAAVHSGYKIVISRSRARDITITYRTVNDHHCNKINACSARGMCSREL